MQVSDCANVSVEVNQGSLENNLVDKVVVRHLGPNRTLKVKEDANGLTNKNRLKMGLNLKSLVKFKSVKQAARRGGSRSTLDLSGLCNSSPCFDYLLSGNGPPGVGLEDGGDVFNNRPPDPIPNENVCHSNKSYMENVCDQVDVDILDAAQGQLKALPSSRSS
ncbi:hypothetical protein SESBI_09678 [Sesbania bispinosa]|nr:hypothetical protein SESBI_09678 [Sesbania bispinosa]